MDDIWQHGGFGENDRKKKKKARNDEDTLFEIARARVNERQTDIRYLPKMPEWTQQAFLFLPATIHQSAATRRRHIRRYWLTYLHTTLPLPFDFFPLDGSKRDSTQDIGFEV